MSVSEYYYSEFVLFCYDCGVYFCVVFFFVFVICVVGCVDWCGWDAVGGHRYVFVRGGCDWLLVDGGWDGDRFRGRSCGCVQGEDDCDAVDGGVVQWRRRWCGGVCFVCRVLHGVGVLR